MSIRAHACFFTDSDVVRTDHKCAGTQAKSDVIHAGGVIARTFTDRDLAFIGISIAAAVRADIDGVRADCAPCGNGGVVHTCVRTHYDIARTCCYGFVTDGNGVVGSRFAVLTERSRRPGSSGIINELIFLSNS